MTEINPDHLPDPGILPRFVQALARTLTAARLRRLR